MYKEFEDDSNNNPSILSTEDDKDSRLKRGEANTNQFLSEANEAGSKGDEQARHLIDDLGVVADTGCENEKEYHEKYFPPHWKYSTFNTHLNVGRMVYDFKTQGVDLPPEMDFTPKKTLMYSFSDFDAEDRLMYQIEAFKYATTDSEIPDNDAINEAIKEIYEKIYKREELKESIDFYNNHCERIEQQIDNLRAKLPPATTEVIDIASDNDLLKEGILNDILCSLSQIDHDYTSQSDLEEMIDAQCQCAKELIQSLDYDNLDEDEKDDVSYLIFKYANSQSSLEHNQREIIKLKKRIKKLI